MDHRALVDRVTRLMLKGPLDDLAKGLIEQDAFDKTARQRAPQIAAEVARMLREKPAVCACGKLAVAVIAGAAVCADHAKTAPRKELPATVKAAAQSLKDEAARRALAS